MQIQEVSQILIINNLFKNLQFETFSICPRNIKQIFFE